MAAAQMIAAPTSAGGGRCFAPPGAASAAPQSHRASSLRRCSTSPPPSAAAAPPPSASASPQQQQLLLRLAAEMQKQPADDVRTFAPSVRALYEALLSVQSPDDVGSLLDNLGVKFPLPVFCSVIRKLGTSCRTSAALAVYEWLHTQSRRPDIFIYCSVLGVARRSARFDLLPHLLRRMSHDGVAPDLVAYKILIACYETMNLHPQAMAAFEEMASKGFPLHDATTIEILLRGCESAADIDGALRVYASACPSDGEDVGAGNEGTGFSTDKLKSAVSGIAYRCIRRMLSDRRSHSHILALIERVESAIGRLSVADYQGIIWSCNGSRNGGGAAEDHLVAQRMVSRRTSMGYRISAAACNHAMNLLQRAGDPDAAMAIFEEMRAEGSPPDADSYRILRPSFKWRLRQQSDGRESVRLLSEMEEHGVVPDGDTFEAAMAGCADRGDAEGAAEIFGRMVEGGRMPSGAAYGALLKALQGGGKKEMAGQVWEHMKKVGVRPNAAAYAAMGYVAEAAEAAAGGRDAMEDHDGSRAVLRSVPQSVSVSESAKPDPHTRASIARCLLEDAKWAISHTHGHPH